MKILMARVLMWYDATYLCHIYIYGMGVNVLKIKLLFFYIEIRHFLLIPLISEEVTALKNTSNFTKCRPYSIS